MTRIDDAGSTRPVARPTPGAAPTATPAPPPAPRLPGDRAELVRRPSLLDDLSSLVSRAKDAVVEEVHEVVEAVEHIVDKVVDKVKEEVHDLVNGGAENLVLDTLFGVTPGKFQTRVVEDNPDDVNSTNASTLQQARTELAAHGAEETRALAKLLPADQAQYQAIAGALGDHPLGRRLLQQALLDGKLPGDTVLRGQGRTLDELHALLKAPLAEGIDRKQLLSDVVGEVADPVRISQHAKNTCGAATAQILLARKHPAEYVRLVLGLASPEGKVHTAGYSSIARKPDWNADNDGGRSVSSRLLQPAFMQLGIMRPFANYHNKEDAAMYGTWTPPLAEGMFGAGEAHLLTQVLGEDIDNRSMFKGLRDHQWNAVKEALTAGRGPIAVDMLFEDSGHFVQIDKIADGRVQYTNPWGQRESMAEDEFLKFILEAQIPD